MSAWNEYKNKKSRDVKPWDLANKKNYIEESEAKKRFDICLSCDRLIQMTKQCRECGCFMNMKAKLKEASCPIGKW
jgi:hypothetical protein